jgi:hypothetical protein
MKQNKYLTREREIERDEKFDIIRDDDWNLNYFMFYTTAT